MNLRLIRTVCTTLALYLAGVSVLFVVENAEILDGLPAGNAIKKRLESVGSLYQLQMSMIPRPLESRYVALVSLSSAAEGTFPGGSCEIRVFLTKLLPRLVEMHPAMIVSDIGFAEDNCGSKRSETTDLIAAIDTASATTPMVIAQGTLSMGEMTEEQTEELRRRGFDESDLLLKKSIPLQENTSIRLGLIRMNADLRKIPIRWYVHDDEKAPLRFEDSLSFAAAKMYRSTFPGEDARLRKLQQAPYHPFGSFLNKADFSTVSAIEIMCDPEHVRAHNWQGCSAQEGNPEAQKRLHGRILMIGFDDDPHDRQATVVGRLPGYALQANYLEALLDARVFQPLSLRYQLLLSFVWLLLVELPFWLHDFRTWKALLYSLSISCLVIFLLYYITLVNLSWYISVGPPSLLAILARVVYQNLERKAKHEGS